MFANKNIECKDNMEIYKSEIGPQRIKNACQKLNAGIKQKVPEQWHLPNACHFLLESTVHLFQPSIPSVCNL